jgi:EmrB/QacA subfamily drug resistance transporter
VLLAVMLTTGLVALDSTIIATAVPSVVHDLGGYTQFPWLFSIYLLTQAVTVPLYGKFADTIGRKPVMLLGVVVFLAGSMLCGIAWSMPALIAFRAVQGIGAGAVQPISMTILGDLYSLEERAKVQGYTASVWGAAAVLGPTFGGVFSEYLSWRWIFFINIPLGGLALWMLATRFHEKVERTPHRIDFAGAALLTGGCSLIILALLEGGVAWAWGSLTSIGIFAVGLLMLVVFVPVEQRAAEPILPLWVFRHRVLIGANITGLVVGWTLIGLSSYIPNYAQGVLGASAVLSGFVLAALSMGWPIAAAFSGRLYMRIGFRDTALIGTSLVVVGAVLCSLLRERTSLWAVAGACFVVGIGLGLTASPVLIAVQSVVGWDRRGVVTGTNMFFRSIGSAVGAATFGAIANSTLSSRFDSPPAALSGQLPDPADAATELLGGHADSGSPVTQFIRAAVYDSTHHVLIALVGVSVVALLAVTLIPRRTEPLVLD